MIAREDTVDLLMELVRIPSVNPHLDPARGTGEAAVAEFAVEWLVAHGVEAWIEEVEPGRPNVTARVGRGVRTSSGPGTRHDEANRLDRGSGTNGGSGRGGKSAREGLILNENTGRDESNGSNGDSARGERSDVPVLAICAHLDTVAVDGMSIHPFDPVINEGRLYGRGSYDMKGGVAAAMAAAASLAQSPVGGTLLLALVADEEYASIGAADWVQRHHADACIVTEPSELRLILAHKGFMWIEIETGGRAAHGSRFDLGESAIERMAPIIAELHAFDASTLRERTHPLTGPASLHAAVVEGGSGWSTYAECCRLRVERRTVPGERPDEVYDEIAKIVTRIDPEAVVQRVLERMPSTCPEDEPVARAVLDAAAAVLGAAPPVAGVAYWMDAAIFAEAGVPTVNIGPAGEGAHAAEEWVDIDSVVACASVLAEAARRFFSRAR